MGIAPTLVKQLAKHGISYDTIHHGYSHSSLHAAHSAKIPVQKMVKTVVLEDDRVQAISRTLSSCEYLRTLEPI